MGNKVISKYCSNWHPRAIEALCDRQKNGEYIIVPYFKTPCRSCNALGRFVFSFGLMSNGQFKCIRTCTKCGDSASYKKFKVYVDSSLWECPQDG